MKALRRLALILALLALSGPAWGQTVGTVSPSPYLTVLDNSGRPVNGALIYTYVAGSTTPATTYADNTLSVSAQNTNPIVASSAGRYVAFLVPSRSYKFVVKTAAGVTIQTVDGVSAIPASAANVDVLGTAGEALTAGQVVYLSNGSGGLSVGQWYKADADAEYSSTLTTVGVVPENITAAASGTIRLSGLITGLTSLSVGSPYYVSSAAGGMTVTAPTPPAAVRVIGLADSTTSLILDVNQPQSVPVGTITMYGGATAPAGWLLLNGAEVSQTTYARLYAIFGTTYNTGGEAGGNFRLPDMRQRFPLGVAASGTGNALGATGGAIDHAHTIAHTHAIPITGYGAAGSTTPGTMSQGATIADAATSPQSGATSTANSGAANPPFMAINFICKY